MALLDVGRGQVVCGAGIGRMREVCGAFCGVVTVLSMVYADPADPKDKSRMYALVQQAAEQYRSRNGGGSIIFVNSNTYSFG